MAQVVLLGLCLSAAFAVENRAQSQSGHAKIKQKIYIHDVLQVGHAVFVTLTRTCKVQAWCCFILRLQ